MPNHVAMVPFMKPHGGIVIGKQASNIARLQKKFGCKIETQTAQPTAGRPLPYFLVRGATERQVNHACLEIYKLLNTSMMNSDKKNKSEIQQLAQEGGSHQAEMFEKDQQIEELKLEVDFVDYETSIGVPNLSLRLSQKEQEIDELKATIAKLKTHIGPSQLSSVPPSGGDTPFNWADGEDSGDSDEETEDEEDGITMN